MPIPLAIELDKPPVAGKLLYRADQHSFDFDIDYAFPLADREGELGTGSLSLGELQIEVAVATGYLLYVWGYHPRTIWNNGMIPEVEAQEGSLRVLNTTVLKAGVTIDLARSESVLTTYDSRSGWVRLQVGDGQIDNAIMFAAGTVAGLCEGELRTLWLHPGSSDLPAERRLLQ